MSDTPYSAIVISGDATRVDAQPVIFCAAVQVGRVARLLAQPSKHFGGSGNQSRHRHRGVPVK